MNTDNILELADHIEWLDFMDTDAREAAFEDGEATFEDETFSMEEYRYACGAPACIAGWAAYFSDREDEDGGGGGGASKAESWLGIDGLTASHLFEPVNKDADICATHESDPAFIDGFRAAQQLRFLAENGYVDWAETPNENAIVR